MNDLIAESKIDKDWLIWYGDAVRAYESLKKQRDKLQEKLTALSGIDYSRDRVTRGNYRTSEQEKYVLKLERLNTEITECEKILIPAKERLKNQIKRLKHWYWRKVLILCFIERWRNRDIVEDFFYLEDDYDVQKDFKYLETVKRWKREALKELESLGAYIPAGKQLNLDMGVKGNKADEVSEAAKDKYTLQGKMDILDWVLQEDNQ